jgi:Ion channel
MTAVESASRRPRSRVARLRASHDYRFVLGLVIASFLFTAAAPDEDWAQSVLVLIQSATLVAALWTSGLSQDNRVGLVVAAIGITAAVLQLASGSDDLSGAIGLLNVLLVAAIAAVVGLGVIDQGEVNRQSITGAICIYVLLGMLFTFVYGAIAKLDTAPFFAQGTDGTPSVRLYFSYVTLATLGYGDYTPAANPGRTLAVVEALVGQLYLVTVVALLVSRVGHRRAA